MEGVDSARGRREVVTIRFGNSGVKDEAREDESSPVELLLRMGAVAIQAVQPRMLLRHLLEPAPKGGLRLHLRDVKVDLPCRRLFAVALGKAALSMAEAVTDRLGAPFAGLGVAPAMMVSTLPGWQWWRGDHPLPTWHSVHAAAAIRDLLTGAGRGDLVLVLLSGGASSLAVMPRRGCGLGEIRTMTECMLLSGAPIEALNVARRERDVLKAGGLARWASPAQVVGLILSDVPGNALWAIGSGPTIVADAPPAVPLVPQHALGHLGRGRWPFPAPINIIIGSNETALDAAARVATAAGVRVEVRPAALKGEARTLGESLACEALTRAARGEHVCVLLGGETSVTVRGRGAGGRNTELALAFAHHARGTRGIWCLALGTDGRDGTCPAAGALVGPDTLERGRRLGGDPRRALQHNDSYTFLRLAGATLITGPTGTNVADIAAVLIDPLTV